MRFTGILACCNSPGSVWLRTTCFAPDPGEVPVTLEQNRSSSLYVHSWTRERENHKVQLVQLHPQTVSFKTSVPWIRHLIYRMVPLLQLCHRPMPSTSPLLWLNPPTSPPHPPTLPVPSPTAKERKVLWWSWVTRVVLFKTTKNQRLLTSEDEKKKTYILE